MALGLSRYYYVNPGTAYEHDGPGSSVVQASHLPHSRPWLQTLAGGRSSQVNTAKSLFWVDEKDMLCDPAQVGDKPTYNDVYVGSTSRGSRDYHSDDNDWLDKNPQQIGQFSVSQAEKALNSLILLDPNSQEAMQANNLLEALKGDPDQANLEKATNFLTQYADIYNSLGERSVGDTNTIMNLMANAYQGESSAANVALLQQFCVVAAGQNQSVAAANIYGLGAVVMENAGQPWYLYDFSDLVAHFNEMYASNPAAIEQIALQTVNQGTTFQSNPNWQPWPGVVDHNGNTVTISPTLWVGWTQDPTDPTAVTVTNKQTGQLFVAAGTVAQMAVDMTIFDAAVQVQTLYYSVNPPPTEKKWSNLTPANTPWTPTEMLLAGGTGLIFAILVARNIF